MSHDAKIFKIVIMYLQNETDIITIEITDVMVKYYSIKSIS